jgi:hypothetical protein
MESEIPLFLNAYRRLQGKSRTHSRNNPEEISRRSKTDVPDPAARNDARLWYSQSDAHSSRTAQTRRNAVNRQDDHLAQCLGLSAFGIGQSA